MLNILKLVHLVFSDGSDWIQIPTLERKTGFLPMNTGIASGTEVQISSSRNSVEKLGHLNTILFIWCSTQLVDSVHVLENDIIGVKEYFSQGLLML